MKPMNETLRTDILHAIENQLGGKVRSPYVQQIECPACGKREAFTHEEAPWVIKCGRSNNCGEHFHAKSLFPHLFNTWTERFTPKTEEQRLQNPTAVADAYLIDGRGIDTSLFKHWYTQEWYQNHDMNAGSSTVRFALPNGFWERVIDHPERFGKLKARAIGSYKGQVWTPPGQTPATLAKQHELWITEGIFDALSLIQKGHCVVSNISSSNYPDQFLDALQHASNAKRPTLIWAQDGDKAGRNAIRKFASRAEKSGWKCRAAVPGSDIKHHDWNDLLQLERLEPEDIQEYRYQGDLLLAANPTDKALLMYQHRPQREFWFSHTGRLYWWKLDLDGYDREMKALDLAPGEQPSKKERDAALAHAGALTCIASAVPRPLYFQSNSITGDCWYYFSVETPDGTIHNHEFTPKQLTSSTEFKARLLGIKNAWFTGTGKQLDRILQEMMNNLRTVQTIDFIGYSRLHKAYIFNELAIRDGHAAQLNREDFFQFGPLSVKSLAKSPELKLNPQPHEYNTDWPAHLWKAFQETGVIAVAFWIGSLLVEQIREHDKSYPFFELVGEAGVGKSTLIEFLWKLSGRADWEGIDPNKGTRAGLMRQLAQVSNLPVTLIEGDRESGKQYDWDEFKPLFNGRPLAARGQKTAGNETYEPPFRGSLIISQNAPIQASEAILSRIIHIFMTRGKQTNETKKHADWLASCPVENLSGFTVTVCKRADKLLKHYFQQLPICEQSLQSNPNIHLFRIAKNHGQLMGLTTCLGPDGLNLFTQEQIQTTLQKITDIAVKRQQSLNADHPIVIEFWEAYDFLQNNLPLEHSINHFGSDKPGIAINLKEFERYCGDMKLRTPDSRTLKQHLKTSQSPRFKSSNIAVRSRVSQKTVKCWVFEPH